MKWHLNRLDQEAETVVTAFSAEGTVWTNDNPSWIMLCLGFIDRQRNRGPLKEGLFEVTEPEVNNSLCGASWGWPVFHLKTLSSSPTDCAYINPESQSTRLSAVSQQHSLGLRAHSVATRPSPVSLVHPQQGWILESQPDDWPQVTA